MSDLNSPPHVTGTGYLLFAQASAGAAWKDMIEPYLISAVTPAPAIATDAQGYAQPVSTTGSASGLSAAPGQIQPDTISWLDREAAAGADPADTGNLADLRDVIYWRGQLPSGTVTDTHSAGPGPAFGLRTDGGGALFFYSLTARLRLLRPARGHLPRHDPRVLLAQPGPPVGHGRLHRAVRRLRPGPRQGRPAGRRRRLQHRRAGINPHDQDSAGRDFTGRTPAFRFLAPPGGKRKPPFLSSRQRPREQPDPCAFTSGLSAALPQRRIHGAHCYWRWNRALFRALMTYDCASR